MRFALYLALVACHPATGPAPAPIVKTNNGGALLVDMQPANRPRLDGAYDFDLLAQGTGKACVKRATAIYYWIGLNDLSKLAPDPLTQQAIAAAAYDAITHLEGADTILLTSVAADSDDETQTCATVVGRNMHLTKRSELGPRPDTLPVPPQPTATPH